MSRIDDFGTGQGDQARSNILNSTNWDSSRPQVGSMKDSDNVSPRSQGQVPLGEKQMEELRKKIEEAKARASPVHELPRQPSQERVRPTDPSATAATAGQGTVPPELISELRKIIREEFVQLNKADVKQEGTDRPPQRPSVGRDRPSSPVRPFVKPAGGPIPETSSSKDAIDDKKPSTTAAAHSQTTVSQKVSPRQSTVRFSDETKPAAPIMPRAEEVRKVPTTGRDLELTAIDKRWGVLFDKDGAPTKRMRHVVKGLANYLVQEFMPQESIVITPEKMAAFYSHHRVEREIFPFAALFRSRPKDLNEALASLYDDMGCQYFLVKADDRSRPSVPSLTPAGFVHWLVTMIQAYPDEEAKRLDKVVSALPIEADSLLDGKPERLPKQISRYLLPEKPLKAQQRLVDEAVKDFKDELEASETKMSRKSSVAKRASPIVVTTSSDKRSPTNLPGSQSSRYVPDPSSKDSRGDETGSSGHDRDRRSQSNAAGSGRDAYDDDRTRRSSMPPPPPPGIKLGRTGSSSIDNSGRSGHCSSSRDTHGSSSSAAAASRTHGVSSSSSSRKNRSPQRKSYSQSVPVGVDRDDMGNDRYRGSGGISPAAVNVANAVLGSSGMPLSATTVSSSASPSTAVEGVSGRDARRNSGIDFGAYRERQRTSLDDSAARMSSSGHALRDRVDQDEGISSRSSKRRSMVLPDVRGPTWDDYLKSSAPKSASSAFKNATSAFLRRGDTG